MNKVLLLVRWLLGKRQVGGVKLRYICYDQCYGQCFIGAYLFSHG
jgi:hypothetical protein